MNRTQRTVRHILDAAARLPVYALIVAATILVIATANDAPHATLTVGHTQAATITRSAP